MNFFKIPLINIMFALVGTVMIVYSVNILSARFEIKRLVSPINATVISQTESRSRNRSYTYGPLLRFTDQNGIEHTFQYPEFHAGNTYSVGEKIEILYNPKHPENLLINDSQSIYTLPFVLFIFGSIFLLMAITPHIRQYFFARTKKMLKEKGYPISTTLKTLDQSPDKKNILLMTLNGTYQGQTRTFIIELKLSGGMLIQLMVALIQSRQCPSQEVMKLIPLKILEVLSSHSFTVYVDPNNLENYIIEDFDIDALLKEVLTTLHKNNMDLSEKE